MWERSPFYVIFFFCPPISKAASSASLPHKTRISKPNIPTTPPDPPSTYNGAGKRKGNNKPHQRSNELGRACPAPHRVAEESALAQIQEKKKAPRFWPHPSSLLPIPQPQPPPPPRPLYPGRHGLLFPLKRERGGVARRQGGFLPGEEPPAQGKAATHTPGQLG
jgi:hypothetical protein